MSGHESGGSRRRGTGLPVPRARIQVPDLPAGAIHRQRLLDRIGESLGEAQAALLVRAPAGFGKTTLLVQWLHRSAAAGLPTAWVTCTERSGSHAVLFADLRDALALALQPTAPRTSAQLMELAEPTATGAGSEVDAMLMVLDELESPVVLVIDDLHVAPEAAVAPLLEPLVAGLPPTLRLAIGSRVEPHPLATRLGLRTGLVRVTEADLALTRAEVAQVVAEAGADPGEIADALFAQSEGWPAAVRLGVLAAVNRRPGDGPALPLNRDPSVADFLTREIGAAIPCDALALLRDTAVVSELGPGLAAALSGRVDAADVLDRLFRTQALVRRAGAGAGEPSYVVHALLRAHLLAELVARDVGAAARQHAAAARWLADAGFPERALDHAVAAGDAGLTASLLRSVGARSLVGGRASTLLEALATVPPGGWDVELAGLAALARADIGDLGGARAALVRAEHLSATTDTGHAWGSPTLARLARFHLRRLEGHPHDPDLPDAFADVLSWQPDPAPPEEELDRTLLLLVTRGQWEFASGRYEASWADLRLALDLATTYRRDRVALQVLATLVAMPVILGDAEGVARNVSEVVSLVEDRGWATHPAMANVYAAGAWSASLQLMPERAEQLIGLAQESLHGNVDPEYATYTALVHASLEATRDGDPTPALALLARFAQGGPTAELTPALRSFPAMQRVRIRLARGDLAGAQEAVADFERWFPDTGDHRIARAQILAAHGMWERCLTELRSVTEQRLPITSRVYDIVMPMLESCAEERLGRRSAARGALLRALAVAAPRGVVRPFWEAGPTMRGMLERQRGRFGVHDDFVEVILQRWDGVDAAGSHHAIVAEADGVPLTPRELEVLRALPSLMTAEELAAAQSVSVNTIRTHLRGLYRKLGVRTRRAAVRRGRELGLL